MTRRFGSLVVSDFGLAPSNCEILSPLPVRSERLGVDMGVLCATAAGARAASIAAGKFGRAWFAGIVDE